MKRKLTKWWKKHWQQVIGGAVLLVIATLLYIVPVLSGDLGYSASEIAAHTHASQLSNIWHNPVFAPYYLLLWLPTALGQHSLLWGRIISGVLAIIVITLSYFIFRSVYSSRVAYLSTILIALSTALLHSGHIGTPDILVPLAYTALFVTLPLYYKDVLPTRIVYFTALVLALVFYTPGMFWLIAAWLVFQYKTVGVILRKLSIRHRIGVSIVGLLVLAPLIYTATTHLATTLQVLGLPSHIPSVNQALNNLKELGLGLFWHYKPTDGLALKGAPILNIVDTTLLLLGVATQFKRPFTRSNRFVLFTVLSTMVLVALGGVSYLMLQPVIYLLIAGGLYYLLYQWQRVYPINDIVRGLGVAIILTLIASSLIFHVRSFYIAWPRSNAVNTTFIQQLKQQQPETNTVPSSFRY